MTFDPNTLLCGNILGKTPFRRVVDVTAAARHRCSSPPLQLVSAAARSLQPTTMDPMMYDLLDDMSVDGHTVNMRCQCGTSFCPFVTLRAELLKCGPEDDTNNNYANWVMSTMSCEACSALPAGQRCSTWAYHHK